MIKAKARVTAERDASMDHRVQPTTSVASHCSIGLVIGTSSTALPAGSCLVSYPENPSHEAHAALVLTHVPPVLPGQSVLLQFIDSDVSRPVVLGIIPGPGATSDSPAPGIQVELQDQGTLNLLATKRLVLRCGKASIVLQENGEIEIRGTDLTSRASGQNAVRGASITLN